jgi:DNA-binding MltR family transcriptional regulator
MNEGKPKSSITKEHVEAIRAVMQDVVNDMASQLPPETGELMKEIMSFRTSITDETDRGAVLMSAAYLDDKLRQLIERKLVQDKKILRRAFEFNGALGSFSARIDFAYLLGIIPKNAQCDLHTIRAIRNQFAHYAAPLSYEDEKIKPLCQKLVFHGVKDAASAGAKYRRSVMGLLSVFTGAFARLKAIDAEADQEIFDGGEAYKLVAGIFENITGSEYPLKHEHE